MTRTSRKGQNACPSLPRRELLCGTPAVDGTRHVLPRQTQAHRQRRGALRDPPYAVCRIDCRDHSPSTTCLPFVRLRDDPFSPPPTPPMHSLPTPSASTQRREIEVALSDLQTTLKIRREMRAGVDVGMTGSQTEATTSRSPSAGNVPNPPSRVPSGTVSSRGGGDATRATARAGSIHGVLPRSRRRAPRAGSSSGSSTFAGVPTSPVECLWLVNTGGNVRGHWV